MRAAQSPKCAALLKAYYCLKFTMEFFLNGDQLSLSSMNSLNAVNKSLRHELRPI